MTTMNDMSWSSFIVAILITLFPNFLWSGYGTTLQAQAKQNPTGTASQSDGEVVPDDEIVATVLGQGIYASEVRPSRTELRKIQKNPSVQEVNQSLQDFKAHALTEKIWPLIQNDFARRNGLQPKKPEIDALMASWPSRGTEDDPEIQKREQLIVQTVFVEPTIISWKTSKALYEKHGGRVGLSKFGPCVSFAGRVAVLEDYQKIGKLSFENKADELLFWARIKDETKSADLTIEGAQAVAFFETPPWKLAKDGNANGKLKLRPDKQ